MLGYDGMSFTIYIYSTYLHVRQHKENRLYATAAVAPSGIFVAVAKAIAINCERGRNHQIVIDSACAIFAKSTRRQMHTRSLVSKHASSYSHVPNPKSVCFFLLLYTC